MTLVIVLMGVSGSGKSTTGRELASKLDWPFYDGDDFHPPENIDKMASGTALNDSDRLPWLSMIRKLITDQLAHNKPAIIACSALKRSYRTYLTSENEGVLFVFLQGSYGLIRKRTGERQDHYFTEELLRSQFEILEAPGENEAIIVDISNDLTQIVDGIIKSVEEHILPGS